MSNSVQTIVATLGVPVVAVMAAGIVLTCIATICRMTKHTNHFIRVFYTVIATGAFGELVAMLNGSLPTVYEFLFFLGIGLLFLFDRRSGIRGRSECCVACRGTKQKELSNG